MAKAGHKKIRYTGGVPISAIVGAKHYVMEPNTQKELPIEVCDAFKAKSPSHIIEPRGERVERAVVPKTIWVANITGNKETPKTVQAKLYKGKRPEICEIPNPMYNERSLSEYWGGGTKIVPLAHPSPGCENEQLNLSGHTITVFPFERVEMDAAVGRWFLNRTAKAAASHAVSNYPVKFAIESRPPTDFEPDESWSLDNCLAYLRFIDPSAKLADNEEKIRAKLKGAKGDAMVEKTKELILEKIFFRKVDPRYALPTKQEFDAFVASERMDLAA